MVAAAQTISTNKNFEMETIVDFSPERVKAPFALRCAAFCIDYMVLLAVPIGWLVAAKFLGGSGTLTIGSTVWIIGIILFIINFVALPLLGGQTLGKMLLGLTILNTDGTPVGIRGILKRNVLGYFISGLTLGIGFLISAANTSGRSLHDFIAGTIVVRGRKTQV